MSVLSKVTFSIAVFIIEYFYKPPPLFFSYSYRNDNLVILQAIGGAEAYQIEALGKAEAEQMSQKAAAYNQYGDAAIMSLILESLPKVCF